MPGLFNDLTSVLSNGAGTHHFDGFDVSVGYGVDIVNLRMPFQTGPVWVVGSTSPAITELTLSFGGRSNDPGGNAAAAELWNALSGGDARRSTPSNRAYCSMTYTGMPMCVFTEFQSVSLWPSPCMSAAATETDGAPE